MRIGSTGTRTDVRVRECSFLTFLILGFLGGCRDTRIVDPPVPEGAFDLSRGLLPKNGFCDVKEHDVGSNTLQDTYTFLCGTPTGANVVYTRFANVKTDFFPQYGGKLTSSPLPMPVVGSSIQKCTLPSKVASSSPVLVPTDCFARDGNEFRYTAPYDSKPKMVTIVFDITSEKVSQAASDGPR
jgi:hypothetical protein